MLEILLVGFFLGLQHATEADHVAAVASMTARERSLGRAVRHGAWWGIGHAGALLCVALVAILAGGILPEHWEAWLESAVGAMLVGLGAHLLYRLRRDRIHLHAHRHEGGEMHFHAHSHRDDPQPARGHRGQPHHHRHWRQIPLRSLAVGMTHGLAGSAALLLLAVAAMKDLWSGLAYVMVFGLGSILGMTLLSVVMSVPLTFAAHRLTRIHGVVQIGIACVTIAVGIEVLIRVNS